MNWETGEGVGVLGKGFRAGILDSSATPRNDMGGIWGSDISGFWIPTFVGMTVQNGKGGIRGG